ASSSHEAMLRAEQALDRARSGGRDGFCVYENSPRRGKARLRLMAIAGEVGAGLNEKRLVFCFSAVGGATPPGPAPYQCLLRMLRTDGTISSAGQFIPAAEQLGLVRLVDRRALELAMADLYANPAVSLAVNVSGTTATDPAWLRAFIEDV